MRALTERWRGLSQRQLRSLLLGSIALHVAIGLYALAALPLFGIQPICRDGSIDYDTPRVWIEGPLARAYLNAFADRFWPRMRGYGTDMVYVTLAQALDWSDIEKQSDLAASDLVRARLGSAAYDDLWMGRTFVPGIGPSIVMGCDTMRKFANADGEWSKRGPQPVPGK